MAKTIACTITKSHPRITAWLKAKEAVDAAEAELKIAREKLEEVFPQGTEAPPDFPIYWQPADKLTVPNIDELPDELVARVPDTKKIHAFAEYHSTTEAGEKVLQYPAGVEFETTFSLRVRKAKK